MSRIWSTILLVPRGSKKVSLHDIKSQFNSMIVFLPTSLFDITSIGKRHSTGVVRSARTLYKDKQMIQTCKMYIWVIDAKTNQLLCIFYSYSCC